MLKFLNKIILLKKGIFSLTWKSILIQNLHFIWWLSINIDFRNVSFTFYIHWNFWWWNFILHLRFHIFLLFFLLVCQEVVLIFTILWMCENFLRLTFIQYFNLILLQKIVRLSHVVWKINLGIQRRWLFFRLLKKLKSWIHSNRIILLKLVEICVVWTVPYGIPLNQINFQLIDLLIS